MASERTSLKRRNENARSAVEHLMGNLAIKRQAIPNAPHAGAGEG